MPHAPRLTRRTFTTASFVLGGAALLAPYSLPVAAQSMNQPDGTYLIASGSDLMPEVPVRWRLIANTAKPEAEAPELPRTLHFIMPTGETGFTVDNLTNGDAVQLVTHTAHAVFGAEGDVEKRYVTSGTAAPYVTFELIVADADDPSTIGSGTWLGATEPFTAPAGQQNMELVSLTVNADDPRKELPDMGSEYPLIGYVLGQPVTIIDKSNRWIPFAAGEGMVLEPGDAVRFAGDVNSRANASLVFARFVAQRSY
jgi:hypothetical protein